MAGGTRVVLSGRLEQWHACRFGDDHARSVPATQEPGHLTCVTPSRSNESLHELRFPDGAMRPLYDAGVACIFGPGTRIPLAARDVIAAVEKQAS